MNEKLMEGRLVKGSHSGRAGESRSEARGNIVYGPHRPWKYERGRGGGGGGGFP